MSLADACLVRMSETLADPLIFYDRHRLPHLSSPQPSSRSLHHTILTFPPARAREKFDPSGTLIDQTTRGVRAGFLKAFSDWVARFAIR